MSEEKPLFTTIGGEEEEMTAFNLVDAETADVVRLVTDSTSDAVGGIIRASNGDDFVALVTSSEPDNLTKIIEQSSTADAQGLITYGNTDLLPQIMAEADPEDVKTLLEDTDPALLAELTRGGVGGISPELLQDAFGDPPYYESGMLDRLENADSEAISKVLLQADRKLLSRMLGQEGLIEVPYILGSMSEDLRTKFLEAEGGSGLQELFYNADDVTVNKFFGTTDPELTKKMVLDSDNSRINELLGEASIRQYGEEKPDPSDDPTWDQPPREPEWEEPFVGPPEEEPFVGPPEEEPFVGPTEPPPEVTPPADTPEGEEPFVGPPEPEEPPPTVPVVVPPPADAPVSEESSAGGVAAVDSMMLGRTLKGPDLTGAAKVWLSKSDIERIKFLEMNNDISTDISDSPYLSEERSFLNLIISNAGFRYGEIAKIETYFGDSYGHYFYGKQPVIIQVAATVQNTRGELPKYLLLKLYKEIFRLNAVSKIDIEPILEFEKCFAKGAFLNLNVSETSGMEDVLTVSFGFLVFKMDFINNDKTSDLTEFSIEW